MTEDKRGVSNGPAEGTNPSEMAPQEDGTKVPLTNDECAEVRGTILFLNYKYLGNKCE